MQDTILFIHGMFQNSNAWDKWKKYYSSRGFRTITESWPYRKGFPAHLRMNPHPKLGNLRLEMVIERYVRLIAALEVKPIIIGHSVGGLLAQILAGMGLAKAAVMVASTVPSNMMTWDFLRSTLKVFNPFADAGVVNLSPVAFHREYANAVSTSEARQAFAETVTPECRGLLRECLLNDAGIDPTRPHVPFLFIAGELDQIVSPSLMARNACAYSDPGSFVCTQVFSGRSHALCREPGWEDIAAYCADWLTSDMISDRIADHISHPIPGRELETALLANGI